MPHSRSRTERAFEDRATCDRIPAGNNFDFLNAEDQVAFANLYVKAVKARGIEIIALADHNTHEWIDIMLAAGERNGIVIFPGCEVTTGTGADGVHLLIIGDRTRTGRDFDQLLAGEIGFDGAHERFNTDNGSRLPASSPKTMMQILDALSEEYLVIAPHALNDNGIASMKTAKGDIRWRALHYERLNAVDPGDCHLVDSNHWNDMFRHRALDQFPCLKTMAYVATSDAYSFDNFGRRFFWIRMGEPTLEALRQAFLDHESRIICSWDPRLEIYRDKDPNQIRHGWIRSIKLGGELTPRGDLVGRVQAVRTLLNLRADSFLEEAPALAEWLWGGPGGEAEQHWTLWRTALSTGSLDAVVKASGMKSNLAKKLQSLDETLRLRLATEIADDVVIMKFLRDGGNPGKENDWQSITEGSPGQRTAAMLGFVLHHGVEPLVLDQPEDDLDTEWISNLVVKELRASRWKRQIIVITHNANIPVNGDADEVVVLENIEQTLRVRRSTVGGATLHHCGPIELQPVRNDIQNIMEGGITAFVRREKRYNNEMRLTRWDAQV